MKAKLVRHAFEDRPDWIVIKESVPLGKIYNVVPAPKRYQTGVLVNTITGEKRNVSLVMSVDENGKPNGLMITDMIELIVDVVDEPTKLDSE